MRCSDIRKDLELYDLLDAREREQVDAHIAVCPECGALFERMQQAQAFIRKAAEVRSEPGDALYLTERIMQSIEHRESKRRTVVRWLWPGRPSGIQPLRYAYGIVSVLLIAGFVFETTRPVSVSPSIPETTTSIVRLNTTAFLRNVERSRKEIQQKTLVWCMQTCQTADGSVECNDCKKQYSKFYSKL